MEGFRSKSRLIAFKPIDDHAEQQASRLKKIHTYDWIIFTSNVRWKLFYPYISRMSLSDLSRVAAIGKKTAQVVEEQGLKVDLFQTELCCGSICKRIFTLG